MSYLDDHTLYYKKSCPSCQKTLSRMDRQGVRLRTCDVSHPNHLKTLIDLTGRRTVPCLEARGRIYYGEDEIIEVVTRNALSAGNRHVSSL